MSEDVALQLNEPSEICISCMVARHEDEIALREGSIAQCMFCFEEKLPLHPPESKLPRSHVRFLKAYALSGNAAASARFAGIAPETGRNLVSGRSKPVVREIFQRLIEDQGLTLPKIAETLSDCMGATQRQYHPEQKDFCEFPDFKTRLGAIKQVGKFLSLEPDDANTSGASTIVIQNNLGGGIEADSTPAGTFKVDVDTNADAIEDAEYTEVPDGPDEDYLP